MACPTPECICREARLAEQELAATATQEEAALLNERPSQHEEAAAAVTEQVQPEGKLDDVDK